MRGLVLGVVAAAAATLVGCAPAPTPSQPTVISPAPSTTTVAPAEHGSLAHCLHEHGVPDSAGTAVLGPPPGVDSRTWDQAMKACSDLVPGPAS